MSTHGEVNHLRKIQNGEMTAISDYVVEEIYTQSYSIGVYHGLQMIRPCTKEDFSCGDEFYYVEMKDAEAFRTFANYMDYTQDTLAEECKADVISFMIGDAPETEATGREARAQRRAYRNMKWTLLHSIQDALYDGTWESYELFA